jgi:putative glycosyltransferase (TIGR04348 family)
VGRVQDLRARLTVLVVTPAPPGTATGNLVTARRWAKILRGLGHRVSVVPRFRGQRADVLVALHARKSFDSIARFRRERPGRPIVVALTGTDLYRDLRSSARARQALDLAARLVVLQPLAVKALPRRARGKARVILQSAAAVRPRPRARPGVFEACVLGHHRRVKDPFSTAAASRLAPSSSKLCVLHVGAAMEPAMAARARAEQRRNPRYRWLGRLPHGQARRLMARCRLLCLTSRLEGGANVVSEAAAAGVPVLSSRIAGSVGLLGRRYPGYFPAGDTRALARLLLRAETDRRFYEGLKRGTRALARRARPERERSAWASLLDGLAAS